MFTDRIGAAVAIIVPPRKGDELSCKGCWNCSATFAVSFSQTSLIYRNDSDHGDDKNNATVITGTFVKCIINAPKCIMNRKKT